MPGLRRPPGLKDFLYLDQRLPNTISPWREGFAFPFATLRNPLLDNDLLDFVAGLPSPLRRTKVLFRRTVTKMYPTLFALPGPSGPATWWTWEPRSPVTAAGIRRLATLGPSLLDDLIDPSAIMALVDQVEGGGRRRSIKARVRDVARAALPPQASNVLRRHLPPERFPPVDLATLVVRLLLLRTVLGERRTPADDGPALAAPGGRQTFP